MKKENGLSPTESLKNWKIKNGGEDMNRYTESERSECCMSVPVCVRGGVRSLSLSLSLFCLPRVLLLWFFELVFLFGRRGDARVYKQQGIIPTQTDRHM